MEESQLVMLSGTNRSRRVPHSMLEPRIEQGEVGTSLQVAGGMTVSE